MTTSLSVTDLSEAIATPEFERDPFPVYAEMVKVDPWRAPSGPT